jgi:two-component system, NtrC family, response regulator HydG
VSRVIVVEDNETMRDGVRLVLERAGHDVAVAATGREGMELVRASAPDVVITDYRMAEMDGMAVLEAVKAHDPGIDVVLITAYGTIDIAVEAMQKGASDFITKPFPPEALRLKLDRVLAHRADRAARERLGEENLYLREEIGLQFNFGEMVGDSKPMREVYASVEKISPTDSSVMIYGDSGTGKELVARAIHANSARADGPFVRVNCGSLPRELVESELFGHERGAFTGAVRRKKGRFELADGGTIFLDEIGDLPLDAQVNILRVLQEKEFDRVGGENPVAVNVRVIAATHRSLKQMVADGQFREDLFYRLEVIPVRLAPLRERKSDIPSLVEHFLHKKCADLGYPVRRLTDRAMAAMQAYGWPGNVRELENVVERTIVLSDGVEVDIQDLPLAYEEGEEAPISDLSPATGEEGGLTHQLEALEKRMIVEALARSEGVKTRAAELLGVKTSALYYKLDKYGLE